MERKTILGEKFVSFLGWCLANVVWAVITQVATRISKEAPMLEGIGYLALIIVGLIALWWYLWGRPTRLGFSDVQYNNMARYVVGIFIAQKYGINAAQLIELNSPEAMEERAQRLRAEEQLSQLKTPTQ